uniref:accessory gene regulator B family protein n=1 Tax=Hathewaya massiliensis TaxID=1964382 RepID=UPI0011594673|nr:accessory gene regulator B family protein [Hathewaya massiliensis]
MDLVSKLSNNLALNINQHMKKDDEEFEKLKYGLTVLLINITKMTVLLIAAFTLGIFKYTFLYLLCFVIIRSFAFGVHAEKSLNCTLSNLIIFLGGTYLSNILRLDNYGITIIFMLNLLLLYKYAPADTKARPIVGKKLRRKLKIKALISASVLMIIALIVPNNMCKTIIALAVLSEGLCITPLTYKILKKEYDNYEKFIKQGV